MTRRVVVTGVGLVCALGIGTEESWKNLVAGKSGITRITHFDTAEFDCQIAGEVKSFDPFQWIEKKELKKMGRFIQVALAAADFAVKMAEWKPEQSDLDDVGVYVASGIGGFDIIEREHIKLMQGGPGKISPFFIPSAIVNLASGHISIRYGARGAGCGRDLLEGASGLRSEAFDYLASVRGAAPCDSGQCGPGPGTERGGNRLSDEGAIARPDSLGLMEVRGEGADQPAWAPTRRRRSAGVM